MSDELPPQVVAPRTRSGRRSSTRQVYTTRVRARLERSRRDDMPVEEARKRTRTRVIDLWLAGIAALLGLVYALLAFAPGMEDSPAVSVLASLATGAAAVVAVRALTWLIVDVGFARLGGHASSSLVRLMVEMPLFAIAAILILKFGMHYDVSNLLTGSALLTAIVGFATQATLGDFTAGVGLQVEQPFKTGDVVQVGDTMGRIETVTWRSIHLRTEGGSRVVIPNSSVAGETVEVLSGEHPVERTFDILVSPTVPPGRVIDLILDVLVGIENVREDPGPEVLMLGMHEWHPAMRYEVTWYPEDYLDGEDTDAVLRKRIWYQLARHGLPLVDAPTPTGEGIADRCEDWLDDHPLLAPLTRAQRRQLAERGIALPIADDEPVDRAVCHQHGLFIVSRGVLRQPVRSWTPPDVGDSDGADRLAMWNPEVLRTIRRQLAARIGPIARVLVPRHAATTTDPRSLYHALAEHISDPTGRAVFLERAPLHPTRELTPGDMFGERAFFLGEELALGGVQAITEAELLVIPSDALSDLLAEEPLLAGRLSGRLAAFLAQRAAEDLKAPTLLAPDAIAARLAEFHGVAQAESA